MSNQDIKCRVASCKFNSECEHCTLDAITVGCETAKDPQTQQETVCASFCCKR